MTDIPQDLFQPIALGPLTLPNRIVMAPLTRSRAGAGDVPGPVNAEYYAQRATAGLLIAEASQISQQGKGYAWTPGIETMDQVRGWKLVTSAVHAKGGRIFLQLWHVGRISHQDLQLNGALPVAPSAIRPEGQAFTEQGLKPHPTPRALETDELPGIVEMYRKAARNADHAGFDGVEIHAANGYLLHQFMATKTNHRTDGYGGSLDARLRLPLEVVAAVVDVLGGERVGIRISPVSPANDIADANPAETFTTFAQRLAPFGLAYLHVVEGATGGARDVAPFDYAALKASFTGLYMANNGYDFAMGTAAIHTGAADLIAFGRPFIGNPDLVERYRTGAALNKDDKATWYGGDAHGYTDYPALSHAQAEAAQ
jgi:N-ethylmaleimide reductase